MKKRFLWIGIVLVLVAGGVYAWFSVQSSAADSPVPVRAAAVVCPLKHARPSRLKKASHRVQVEMASRP